jgi:hypothetical protein
MKEVRGKDFYKKILRLKNVKLIKQDYNSLDLIDLSLAVVTLTGTVSIESTVRRKNVIMFGNIIYSKLPNVFKIKSIRDLRSVLEMLSQKNWEFFGEERDIKFFFRTFQKFSYYTDYDDREINNPKLATECLISFISHIYGF